MKEERHDRNVAWLALSRFESSAVRARQVRADLEAAFAAKGRNSAAPLDSVAETILSALIAPLQRDAPTASQAAEAALTISQFSIAENRVLDLTSGSFDLTENGRLASDRSVGDFLCDGILSPRNIPSTRGPFQSSSFRAGYVAAQVRDGSLRDFVRWHSVPGRSLRDVQQMAEKIVDAMQAQASKVVKWIPLAASRITFTTYLKVRERLLSSGSGGAFEQYLLAGLLQQEYEQGPTGLRVETKNVGATDRSSGTVGDIQIRYKLELRSALEVTAAGWNSKLAQLNSAAAAGLSEITIAAPLSALSVSAADLSSEVEPVADRLGIDPAIVDLYSLMDVTSARLSKHGRAEALYFVYKCLVRWHSRQPVLAERLVAVCREFELQVNGETISSEAVESSLVHESIERVHQQLIADQVLADPTTPRALRDLADSIEHHGADCTSRMPLHFK